RDGSCSGLPRRRPNGGRRGLRRRRTTARAVTVRRLSRRARRRLRPRPRARGRCGARRARGGGDERPHRRGHGRNRRGGGMGGDGRTTDAGQYLLKAIQYRAYGEAKKDVVVDADGYRERRRRTLEALADEIAERVRESGTAEELEPMTSVERKVVHLRLKEAA